MVSRKTRHSNRTVWFAKTRSPRVFRLQTQAEASAPDQARSLVLDRVVRGVEKEWRRESFDKMLCGSEINSFQIILMSLDKNYAAMNSTSCEISSSQHSVKNSSHVRVFAALDWCFPSAVSLPSELVG
jgi:hypothetical protein